MSWAYDVNGLPTWVPWIVGEPSASQVIQYVGGKWVPATISTPAPVNAQYVTLATDASLTAERVLTAGDGITITDAGAGSTVTVAAQAPTYVLTTNSGTAQALYKFQGDLTDSSGNGLDLTATGATAVRYSARPDGTKYITPLNANTIRNTGDWSGAAADITVEAIIQIPAPLAGGAANGYTIADVSKTPLSGVNTCWSFRINSVGLLSWYFYDAGNVLRELTSSVVGVPYGVLFHVAATRSISGGDTTATIYINGVQAGTTTFVGQAPRAVASQVFSAFCWSNGAAPFNNGTSFPDRICMSLAVHYSALSQATLAARALEALRNRQ